MNNIPVTNMSVHTLMRRGLG